MGTEVLETTESSSVSRTWIGSIFSILWKWPGWLSWSSQSDTMLRNMEKKILSCVKTAYKRFYVDIGAVVGPSDKIWTVSLNDESPNTPLVLLHGLASGLALWCPNLDSLAAARPVYAFDILGFGRSSRPKFSSDPVKVEAQWVESVEEWRREMNLDGFVLLGHSLGGYIATAYALKYPERVRHLILADPWGFPERPANASEKHPLPVWLRALVTVMQPLNPLAAVRAAGPLGRWLVRKARPDIARKYAAHVPDAHEVVPEYIYQCNSQTPSGESAFHSLMEGLGWAKRPMVLRVHQLAPALPVTVLCGARSWVDSTAGHVLAEKRNSDNTFVQIINGAGHHVYLDKPEVFNKFVNDACAQADSAATQAETAQDVKESKNNEPTKNLDHNDATNNLAEHNETVKPSERDEPTRQPAEHDEPTKNPAEQTSQTPAS